VQIVKSLQPDDGPRRASFATEILRRIPEDNDYLKRVCFSDQATFHTSGVVNRHNDPHLALREHACCSFQNQQGSPKLDVWCGIMHNKVIGPIFFNEPNISANVYLRHVGTLRCTSEEFQPWIIFQQDGARTHWGSHVRRFLDATFPNRWIGRDGPTPWPPQSPGITPLASFYGGMLRTTCFRHQFQILQI